MIQLLYEPELLSVEALRAEHSLRPGVAFVPCSVCSAPVDLAFLGDRDEGPFCDAHGLPLLVACAQG